MRQAERSCGLREASADTAEPTEESSAESMLEPSSVRCAPAQGPGCPVPSQGLGCPVPSQGPGCPVPAQGLGWFAALLDELDASNAQNHKLAVLRSRFAVLGGRSEVSGNQPGVPGRGSEALSGAFDDLAWVVYFLCGGKLPRAIRSATLRAAALRASGLEPWLFEACYAHAGDLAETIACCLPRQRAQGGAQPAAPAGALHAWLHSEAIPATRLPVDQQIDWLIRQWAVQSRSLRFACNKLLTGGFRLGISRALVLRALAQATSCDERDLAQRFMGWMEYLPDGARLHALFGASEALVSARPLPFCLANAHDGDSAAMGPVSAWQIEWKWDGIRVQWIRSGGASFLWSRGEELISEQFPELALGHVHQHIPDQTVLDGELLAWDPQADRPAGFAALQKRMHRKRLPARLIADYPVRMLVYDILALGGEDLRDRPLEERRQVLASLAGQTGGIVHLSPLLQAGDWQAVQALRAQARSVDAEGLMLKHRASVYRGGRGRSFAPGGERGGWWKWKLDPLRIDAVLVYAQAGHGRRANLFSDYTFAVHGPAGLLTVAKAYSGLSDDEMREVDARIRKTTLDQYGPVRAVEPTMVFELGFEAIHASTRHRAGVALRFPRMLRWRKDKSVDQADRLEDLLVLLRQPAHAGQ